LLCRCRFRTGRKRSLPKKGRKRRRLFPRAGRVCRDRDDSNERTRNPAPREGWRSFCAPGACCMASRRRIEKEVVMRRDSQRGEIDVCETATTVIEVGVDVPNATVMVIRACGAVWAGACSSVAWTRGPRWREVVLHFDDGRKFLRTLKSGWRRMVRTPGMVSSWRSSIWSCAVLASFFGRDRRVCPDFRVANLLRRDRKLLELAKVGVGALCAESKRRGELLKSGARCCGSR